MKVTATNQIEKINKEIKQTKELLKLFFNGEDYFKQKMKKLKTDIDEEQFKNLKEDDLKRQLDELTTEVQSLKRTRPMITIYNDGSDEHRSKISTEEIQLFVLSSLKVNLNATFGLIKNNDKLDRACVFVIEDDRLAKLVLNRLETDFDHHIQFQCEEAWIQNLLSVNLKKSMVDFKQIELNRSIESSQANGQQVEIESQNQQSSFNHATSVSDHHQRTKLDNQFKNAGVVKRKINKKQAITRKDLLLSVRQLIKEHYPLPVQNGSVTKTTKSNYKPVCESSPMFSMDCEMCKTEKGDLDVTRISLIDEQFNVLIDEFVKPKERIIDYLTTFSGIKKEHLENVNTTLDDIHQRLDVLLPEDAILVGHSLNCDLQSLQLSHPYVIDTSCIYNFSVYFNSKPSLRQLSNHYLKSDIQNKEGGHCSIEDARAAMQLVQLKLSKDITFGDQRLSRLLNHTVKPTMTLTEFLQFKDQFDVKIVYDYLELESLPRFISITSKHTNKIIDKIAWSLSLTNSISIVILKGRCLIKIV